MTITDLPITLSLASSRDIFIVSVSADSNDADYIYNTTTYTPAEFADIIPAIRLLEDIDNTEDMDGISGELSDYLWSLIPSNEYGCHSICIDSIQYISSEGITYDVTLTS